MRRVLVAVAITGLVVGTTGAAFAAPPGLPKDCHEWNALLHIQNVRSCDDPPPSRVAGPPPVPVGVHVNDDGSVCVGISYQVPQCTPPLD